MIDTQPQVFVGVNGPNSNFLGVSLFKVKFDEIDVWNNSGSAYLLKKGLREVIIFN